MDLINGSSEIAQSKKEIRQEIDAYEEALKRFMGSETGDKDKINDNGLSEYIVGGSYIRILDIPADTTIVSKLWKTERLWIIISGEVKFKTEEGFEHIKAPYVAKAPFGSKVALYTVTPVKWAAITGTKSENLEEIEAEMITEEYITMVEGD